MIKRCIGCGVKLQNQDPLKLGYINDLKNNYCQRCFRLTHYNEYKTSLKPMNLTKFLNNINKDKKFIIYMIDFFNINKITMKNYHKIKQKKILVITKLDLIPKSLKSSKIINFLKEYYKIKEDIFLISNIKNSNINSVLNYLKKLKDSIYLVGYTNSGKSSFINTLLNKNNITTSIMPNTTLANIKIMIDNLTIYDTPGLIYNNFNYNDINFHKKINSKKVIKPKTFQTKENFSLAIDNYLKIGTNSLNSFTLYISNELEVKKKFEEVNAEEIKIPANSDLVIYGLGFINIKKECIIKCDKSKVEVRPSMFKGDVNE